MNRIYPQLPVVLALLCGSPLQASDFSRLAEPAYARIGLLSDERVLQVECAGLALHQVREKRSSNRAANQRFRAAVSRRLSADLGDDEVAESFIAAKAQNHSNAFYGPELLEQVQKTLRSKCRGLIEAAERGEKDLSEALGQPASSPLQLPGPNECLATFDYVIEQGTDAGRVAEEGAAILRQHQVGGSDKHQVSDTNVTKTHLDGLRRSAPDRDALHSLILTCMPAVQRAARHTGNTAAARIEIEN